MSPALGTVADFIDTGIPAGAHRRLIEIDRGGVRRARTVAELAAAAGRAAYVLRDVQSDADTVLLFDSVHDLVPAVWACLRAGLTSVVRHETFPGAADDGLPALADRLRDPVLVTTSTAAARLAGSTDAAFDAVLAIDDDATGGAADQAATGPARPGAGAFLMATSGTTGHPKLAVVPHRVWWARTVGRDVLTDHRSRLVAAPFDGITGLQVLLVPFRDLVYVQPARLGACPEEVPAAIEEFGVQSFGLPTSLAARVADVLEATPDRYDLSSVELLGFGAETIVAGTVRRLGALVRRGGGRGVKVAFGYGATETGLLCRSAELDPDAGAAADPVSVGRPLPGWSLRVVDGQVEVCSEDRLFAGYRDDVESTAACLTPDGWYRTGDRGFLRDGELVLTGREQATIIVNGRTVPLDEVEAAVRAAAVAVADVIAVAHRPPGAQTDELLVFLVEADPPAQAFDETCRDVRAVIGRSTGLVARHLVRIAAGDLPRTRNGKVRRDELARGYAGGQWAPHIISVPPESASASNTTVGWLMALWRDVLRLDRPPGEDEDFHALGGDSLAAAEILHVVESYHQRRLDLAAFFAEPTIAEIDRLLRVPPPAVTAPEVVRGVEQFLRGWRGERLVPGGLVVARSSAGTRPPLCWVFQGEVEFVALSDELGPDQPLYGMRSCVGVAERYTAPVIDAMCDVYLRELLNVPGPISLGGNCQGAIIALALARRLREHGRPPSRLVLMEWSFFDRGGWDGPTLLVYGAESYAARHYEATDPAQPWRADFPDHTVAATPGAYGELFQAGNVERLAATLRAV